MIDKENIKKDLESRQYTQGKIAKRNSCGISTVRRVAKRFDLLPGQGIKNYWQFTKVTKELCYLIGAYLTDGYVKKEYKTENIRQFGLNCVDEDFANHVELCINEIGLKTSRSISNNSHRLGRKPQFVVSCYSSMFAQWLYDITENKSKIPDFIFNATQECLLEFVAACIDGDGSVDKSGSIRVANTSNWINDFPQLLDAINIRNRKRLKAILESGKKLYSVSIRRQDFRALDGECKIQRKQNRILNGKEQRTWRRPKRYKYTCPICNEKVMSRKNAQSCQKCYLKSEALKNRLRNQASKAGIAGCKARWG